jgi:phosphoribosylformylglycinamidine (FGAM) synthase-like enzyme
VGGNVSLYNETAGAPILGQVFIGMVGVREDAQ